MHAERNKLVGIEGSIEIARSTQREGRSIDESLCQRIEQRLMSSFAIMLRRSYRAESIASGGCFRISRRLEANGGNQQALDRGPLARTVVPSRGDSVE